MKFVSDTHDKSEIRFSDEELTEEQFLEKFAALEDNLALLQIQMRRCMGAGYSPPATPRKAGEITPPAAAY